MKRIDMTHWQTSRFRIDLDRPQVMGIVNLTPDSFSDGGAYADSASALQHCERLLRDGADILDLGAESTRPGSLAVPAEEELARLLPVLRAASTLGCPISIDTNKAEVMQRVLAEGADVVNDIWALRRPLSADAIAAHPTCGICLMHMRGSPESMQSAPAYQDVVIEVRDFLAERVVSLRAAGIAAERIVVDPGIGFGKSVVHNLELLRRQPELLSIGRPLLVGWSRKSTLGVLTGRAAPERQSASVAAALAAVQLGAKIVRVHDVAATVDALKVWKSAGLGAR
jgi:dihydropteroate synthase